MHSPDWTPASSAACTAISTPIRRQVPQRRSSRQNAAITRERENGAALLANKFHLCRIAPSGVNRAPRITAVALATRARRNCGGPDIARETRYRPSVVPSACRDRGRAECSRYGHACNPWAPPGRRPGCRFCPSRPRDSDNGLRAEAITDFLADDSHHNVSDNHRAETGRSTGLACRAIVILRWGWACAASYQASPPIARGPTGIILRERSTRTTAPRPFRANPPGPILSQNGTHA
jgi:hypothetical protein